jgi:hypothetical protein
MSISIYYTAWRDRPVSVEEQALIDGLRDEYAIEGQLKDCHGTRKGPNGESFCVYDPADPTESGATAG